MCNDTTTAAIEALLNDVTPGSKWRVEGKPDPHGTRYDCPRSALPMANLSDDEMANGVYLFGDAHPHIADLLSGKAKTPGMWLDAAKNRIRWLSRKLDALRDLVPALATELTAARQERDEALALKEKILSENMALNEANDGLGSAAYLATARAENAETEAAALRGEVARLKKAAYSNFDSADWFWRTMDPDDSGDTPEDAVIRGMIGHFCVCEIASSYRGPTRYGFVAPSLDLDDDGTEFVHFATQAEAIDAAKTRAALTGKGGEG